VIVGAYDHHDESLGPVGPGSAYVFTRSGGTWTQQTKLTASDGAEADEFGSSVAISGDTAIVGASKDDDNGSDSGSGYVFTRSGGTWTEQTKLAAGDAAAGDWFGYSVAISDGTVIVGAQYAGSGSAYFCDLGRSPSVVALTSGSVSSVDYGSTFPIKGTLKTSSGIGLFLQNVILQSKAYGASGYTDTTLAAITGVGGAFSFSAEPKDKTYYRVRPASSNSYSASGPAGSAYAMPKAYIGTPKAPKTMRRSRDYTVSGFLQPRHESGTYPVRIYRWKRTASGKWKSYGHVKASASDYSTHSKYSSRIALPSTGQWRLRAYALADAKHAKTWSSAYGYVTVK